MSAEYEYSISIKKIRRHLIIGELIEIGSGQSMKD
jgi:hypothetical protein